MIILGILKNRRLALWKKYLVPFGIWAITVAVIMVGYKLPYVLFQGIHDNTISVPTILRGVIMGVDTIHKPVLLAANVSLNTLQASDSVVGANAAT